MSKFLLFALSATAALAGADDNWHKVMELKTGTDLRIFKTGAKQPIMATMDEATTDHIVVVVKKEQIGIEKSDIDRIDARHSKSGNRVTTTASKHENPVQVAGPTPRGGGDSPAGTDTTSTSVSFGSKGDFETIYRRGK